MSERWKPKNGDSFWSISWDMASVLNVINLGEVGEKAYANCNCFRTREEAEAAAEKVKALLLSLHDTTQVDTQVTTQVEMLPDWCKAGVWIYTSSEQYLKIKSISIDRKNVKLSNGANWSNQDIIDEAVYARLRPYNADEMKALVGKVTKDTHGNISFITGYCVNKEVVYSGTTNFTAECLLHSCCFLDNAPCGVLEHIENGEWVE